MCAGIKAMPFGGSARGALRHRIKEPAVSGVSAYVDAPIDRMESLAFRAGGGKIVYKEFLS